MVIWLWGCLCVAGTSVDDSKDGLLCVRGVCKDVDLIVDVCEGRGVVLWSMAGVCADDSVVVEGRGNDVWVKCELPENVVCACSVYEGVDESAAALDDR